MSYTVKSRSTNKVICLVSEVEEALIAEASGFRVDGNDYVSILELAKARADESPDYHQMPEKAERYVRYRTKAGRSMVCEVVRLFAPDDEGYPQLCELVNPQRPDGSFCVQAREVSVIDLSKMTPALADALVRGVESCDEDGVGQTPKLKHGLRRE